MAGNIKGITIEFRGETTKLDKALRQINNETRALDKELNAVNKALKFNPTNIELWRQKQDLLKKKISETEDKLKLLKDQQKNLDARGVDKNSAEYQRLRREIIETESKLKTFKGQLREIGNVSLKKLSDQFKKVGDKATEVGKTMTTKVTAPLVAGYTVAAKYASDYEESLNKLDVAFGENSDSVKEWAETARAEFGLSKVQASEAAASFGALGKGIGLSNKEAADMSTSLGGLSADLGSYFNVGTDESAKALEGIFTGESEALKKFGVVMTDTNLAQFAADQGLVWKEMDQTQKVMLRYQFVMDKTKDAQGDFARTSDGTANSIKIFKATIQDLATAIGTNLLPIITPIIQKITEWINKFNELSPETQKIITYVGLLVAALGPLLVVFGSMANGISSILSLGSKLAPLIGTLVKAFNPWLLVLGAAVAAGVYLYKNWDTIKAKAKQLWSNIKATFNGIKSSIVGAWNSIKTSISNAVANIRSGVASGFAAVRSAIVNPINAAKNAIQSAWNKIKSILGGKIKIPHIKLPHFSISGKFSIIPPSVPKLSISWYKTGGIFDSPSVIGVGEAGSEAVVPLDKLWEKLDRIADAGGAPIINIYGRDGQSTTELAREVERVLVRLQRQRNSTWQSSTV